MDEKEKKRIKNLDIEFFEKHGEIEGSEVFSSQEIISALSEAPLSLNPSLRGALESLPLNCVLYSKVIVTICPWCPGTDTIEPYLKKKMLLPLLSRPLSEYKAEFIDLMLKYPHIGVDSYLFLKRASFCEKISSECHRLPACPLDADNFDKRCDKIVENVTQFIPDRRKAKKLISSLENSTFPTLFPPDKEKEDILHQIEEAVINNNTALLRPLQLTAFVVDGLKTSNLLQATPEIRYEYLHTMGQALNSLNLCTDLSKENKEIMDEKKWLANALGLTRNPAMPLEEYLDIVAPRREKINRLINSLLQKDDKVANKSLEDEIWKINNELNTSKKIEMYDYFTTFTSNNRALISGLLVGGALGYSTASITGCGFEQVISPASSLTGSIVGKASGKYIGKKIKTPKAPRKTIEWLKAKFETPEEYLLASILHEEVPLIQVWSLRKKLNSIK